MGKKINLSEFFYYWVGPAIFSAGCLWSTFPIPNPRVAADVLLPTFISLLLVYLYFGTNLSSIKDNKFIKTTDSAASFFATVTYPFMLTCHAAKIVYLIFLISTGNAS
jgi:hypothetical protein